MASVRYLQILDSCAECTAAQNRGLNPFRQNLGVILAVDNEHRLVEWPLRQGHPAQHGPQRGDVVRSRWLHIVGVAEAINDYSPKEWHGDGVLTIGRVLTGG
jgi:hypothetical protein